MSDMAMAIVIPHDENGREWMVATLIGLSCAQQEGKLSWEKEPVSHYAVRHTGLTFDRAVQAAHNYNTTERGVMPIPPIVSVGAQKAGGANWFIVCGRAHDDDEAQSIKFQADDRDDAVKQFKEMIGDPEAQDGESGHVYIDAVWYGRGEIPSP